jgi:hypothetical protein
VRETPYNAVGVPAMPRCWDGRKAGSLINFGISEILLDAAVEAEIYRFGPARCRGVSRIVTDVRRDAVDADGAQRRGAPEADGEVVWS